MKKRKFAAVLAAVMMGISVTACSITVNGQKVDLLGGSAAETSAESGSSVADSAALANPVTECSEDEMVQKTGIDLPAPEGAENVSWAYLELEDGTLISQMTYSMDGHELTERACATDMTSLVSIDLNSEKTDASDILNIDMGKGNISGLNYEWNNSATQLVSGRNAVTQCSEEGPCYIAWLDVVPGILYNLSCKDELDSEQLVDYAEQVFVELQGES